MARLTVAQRIAQENEQQALASFLQALSELPDPRRAQGCRYPLHTVVVIALMAAVCGAEDAEAYEAWGAVRRSWLETLLPMLHGAPTQDVYLRVFAAIDPDKFEALLRNWAALLACEVILRKAHRCGWQNASRQI